MQASSSEYFKRYISLHNHALILYAQQSRIGWPDFPIIPRADPRMDMAC